MRFDPRSASALHKTLGWLSCVLLVLGTLWLLGALFAALSDDLSAMGMTLRYVRYAAAGFAGLHLAPLAFMRLGWAERLPER